MQEFSPQVLDKNFSDLTVQVWLILHEAVLTLERVLPMETLERMAMEADKLKEALINAFELEAI